MNEKLRIVLKKRYEAEIEDAKYKIRCYSEQELIIPEHPDITGEVDKLLEAMSNAEEKLEVMELHYGKFVANRAVLQHCGNIVLLKYHTDMTVYMYGKKNKKKNKNYSRNNVILSLWSRSVGIYDFRVDKML